jgi:Spy/CpxP family protein refolding chaperone
MSVKNFIKGTLMLSLLIASSVAFAQQDQMPKRTPEERAQRQTQWMQKNLNLTDEQNKKVYDIILSSAKQVDNARNSGGGDMRSQMQDINAKKNDALKGVLTGDQFQKYQQHAQEMQQRRTGAHGGMPGGEN